MIAYGYTKTDRMDDSERARKNIAMPITTPNMAKSSFMPISQIKPSRSKVKIKPGARMLQEHILRNIYPTKLLFSIAQETNVNMEMAKKTPTNFSDGVEKALHLLRTIAKAIKPARGPTIKEKIRRFFAFTSISTCSLSSFVF